MVFNNYIICILLWIYVYRHEKLYDALCDDFQIEDTDSDAVGLLIENKQEFIGNRGPYSFINKIREKRSKTMESFPVFECYEGGGDDGKITMEMSFNVLEYRTDATTTAYNGKLTFEYSHSAHRFMIKKYQYGAN